MRMLILEISYACRLDSLDKNVYAFEIHYCFLQNRIYDISVYTHKDHSHNRRIHKTKNQIQNKM